MSKATKAGTVAERVVWMTRTSDVHGSHLKTDLDSYMALIRRKIQEKCSTTAELITQIRRNKIGESGHVTPNEFRFTLIKFGVILPQPLVDRIFNVFDSDRSGTMDFDEFAMWIMNSEFRPAVKGGKKGADNEENSPRHQLRRKLANCVQDFGRVFDNMKKQISFIEFVSDINRTGLPLSDRDARSIFLLLDPADSGFIESAWLRQWAETGKVNRASSIRTVDSNKQPKSVKEVVNRVIGWNTRQLESAFSHIVMGQGTKLPFEEFRRCLINGGVGKSITDMRDLFMALGGEKENLADVDLLFKNLDPVVSNPEAEVSSKRTATAVISTSRADRRLRDSLRKCFKDVRDDIHKEDPGNTGFIAAPTLHNILVHRCMPLTFEDFRFIVQQVKKQPGTERIDYHHFLSAYNPAAFAHQLEGLARLRKSGELHHTHATTLGSSASQPALATHAKSSGNQHAASTTNLAATLPSSPLRLTALSLPADDLDIGRGSRTTFANTTGSLPDMKKTWQQVLRECHRADPERTGQVNRMTFIAALERADNGKTMTPEAINKFADQYALSNGLINYLLLFRQYLSDMGGRASTASLTKSQSMTGLGDSSKPVHPWDFGYKRERKQEQPYWQQASSVPKDPDDAKALSLKFLSVPPATEKTAEQLSTQEKEMLLGQFQHGVLQLCHRCYHMFAPVWRPLRNQFKKQQIPTQKGSILTPHFLSILETNGISLRKTELGVIVKNFRGIGMQDIIRYDDFLRVCMLVKDRSDLA